MNHGATSNGPSAADRVTAEETELMLGLLGRGPWPRSASSTAATGAGAVPSPDQRARTFAALPPPPRAAAVAPAPTAIDGNPARTGPKVLVTAP